MKTAGPSDAALPALRQSIWALEPEVVFTEDVSAAEVVAATMSPTRIGRWLLGAFGALALLLSTVGLYGVVAYAVSLRTREVGIRMALGAERRQVLWMMFRQGGRLALAGLALGAIASTLVGQLIDALLYGGERLRSGGLCRGRVGPARRGGAGELRPRAERVENRSDAGRFATTDLR